MRVTEEDEDSDRVYDVVLGLRGRDIRVADHSYVLDTSRVFCHRHLATTTTTTTAAVAAVSWAGTAKLRMRVPGSARCTRLSVTWLVRNWENK